MTTQDPIVILGAARTPLGNFNGFFKELPATVLGKIAIQGALKRAAIDTTPIDEIIMGCVLPAGLGQAPARQAALLAELPEKTGATTINKMCGSGMKAVMLAYDALRAQTASVVVAGGMENMSRAPYLLPKARFGYRMGHSEIIDHMMRDGLEDATPPHHSMGFFAEQCAEHYDISRATMDAFAVQSLARARLANEDDTFAAEIEGVPLTHPENTLILHDENPFKADANKIPLLKPVFKKEGRITAANASSISDGASALILARESTAHTLGLTPIAKIIGHHTHAQAPAWFTTAPIYAIQGLLDKIHWSINDVSLFEINEAFAVVTLVTMQTLGLSPEQVNIHGGACALGHPIGASGARILVTLIHALQKHHQKRGVASLCIGGGEATAVAIELL